MDEIRFEIGKRDDPAIGFTDAVLIFINERNLTDLVREIELPFATRDGQPDLAGSYVGLPPDEIFLPSRRLLCERETYYDHDSREGKLAVLGCICGDPGCWPLRVRISPRDNAVIWSDFEQPHRRSWQHNELGPFVFDSQRYVTALRRERLADLAP